MRGAFAWLIIICTGMGVAQASTSNDVRRFLEGLDAGALPVLGGQLLHEPERLSELYRAREHAPIWTADGPLADRRGEILHAIEQSTRHGLDRRSYHFELLTKLMAEDQDGVAFELLASDAFLRQVRHRATGAVSPRRLDPDWHLVAQEEDPVAVLEATVAGRDVTDALERLWPDSEEYWSLVARRAEILALGELEVQRVPPRPADQAGSDRRPGTAAQGPVARSR